MLFLSVYFYYYPYPNFTRDLFVLRTTILHKTWLWILTRQVASSIDFHRSLGLKGYVLTKVAVVLKKCHCMRFNMGIQQLYLHSTFNTSVKLLLFFFKSEKTALFLRSVLPISWMSFLKSCKKQMPWSYVPFILGYT